MNLFILDEDPVACARAHCDKHVVKMILETAQLLCTAHHALGTHPDDIPYRKTHEGHPCAVWVRESEANYRYTVDHGAALCAEYTRRYERRHKSQDVIEYADRKLPWTIDQDSERDPFVQCVPDEYKVPGDPVAAYRAYYIGEKSEIAQWNYCEPPAWWPKGDQE